MQSATAVFEKSRSENIFFRLLLLIVFFIPFQQRLYKLARPLSLSLIDPKWNFPEFFEIHLDAFITDFGLLFLLFFCFKRALFWEGERKYLSLFLCMGLISIIASPFASYILPYWRFLHLLLPAVLYFVLSQHRATEDGFNKVAHVVLAASLIECAIGITQYFVQHSLGLKGLGEPTLIATQYIGPHFPIFDGAVWIFDRLFHVVREKSFVLRASGTLPHPNVLGGMMVFGLLMTYYLYQISKKRSWLALAILVQLFCLFISYSRAALYAWAMVTALWIGFMSWREKKIHSLFWITGGCFAICLGLLFPQLFERGGVVSYNVVTQSSDTLRVVVQDIGVSMVKAHPWLGIGFNNYMISLQPFVEGMKLPATYVHNAYLHLATEIGIPGVLALLVFCFLILKKGWQNRDLPSVFTAFCLFIAFLLIGLADYYLLYIQQTRLIFFLLAGWISAASLSRERTSHPV